MGARWTHGTGVLWWVAALLALGPACTCGSMSGDEGPVDYVRCGQAKPPDEASWQAAGSRLDVSGRQLRISGKKAYRIAAFEGPVGAPVSFDQLAKVVAAKPDLVLYLGGLGDDLEMATTSLQALARTELLVVFLPGGADRWPVVEEAFDALPETARTRIILAAGLHRLDVGETQFAVVPGALLGRYAVGDEACGFGPADIDAVKAAFAGQTPPPGGRRLLAWTAPSGWGLSAGVGRLEIGSPDLHILAAAVGAQGGLFAHPRGEATGVRVASPVAARWIVPRLAPEGSVSADGAYADSDFAVLQLPEGALGGGEGRASGP